MFLTRVIFSMAFAPAKHFDQIPFVFSERAKQCTCKADAKSSMKQAVQTIQTIRHRASVFGRMG
jgi:hypothetical protein